MPYIGQKDSKGRILILGGRNASILKATNGLYLIGEDICASEENAVAAYNRLNSTQLQLDYITKYFQPWFNKEEEKRNKEKLVIEVPSATDPTKKYRVEKLEDGSLFCECTGFRYRYSCWHVDAVKEMLEGKET